jgi:hypothetical protein
MPPMAHNPRELVFLSVLAFVWGVTLQVQSQTAEPSPTPQLVYRQPVPRAVGRPHRPGIPGTDRSALPASSHGPVAAVGPTANAGPVPAVRGH